ncbi:6-carboxytetrahydropterin synthase [Kineosporia rhizophila]|uniref:6-pyruvoyl trahydropterin synthase family protein n=1 Tax=Kineosporia rhizophila TaxID=84633 RepID=UPI000AA22415|nr:6-carboxytetrahydropterin synthase [Kineosporia rhizophila]MCE0536052.1 6-carboxytetrahydropterin synthase [Kineosporia rhizophila]
MSYVITKAFRFEAAHHLNAMPEGHQCAQTHGHSYTASITLEADSLDGRGMVTDFGELAPVGDYIRRVLDHSYLNTIRSSENPGYDRGRDVALEAAQGSEELVLTQPTSELLAEHLFRVSQELLPADVAELVTQVKVSETATSHAIFRPAGRVSTAQVA